VRRMLVAALATSLIAVARAEEPAKAAPGAAPATATDKPAAAKNKKKKDGQARGSKARPKAEAKPEQQKPCEPIRPCPIE
jgi:hypothetical protein